AHAIDLGFRDFQMHGFASQGYTYTSGNDFFGNSQGDGSLEFTELGLNVLGHPLPNLLFAVQGIYRDTGGSDEGDFRLDYANLDLTLPVRDDLTFGIRGGRVKNPFGLYSESRDAIWTRPSVLLPQSIYFDSLGLRSPVLSSDGGMLYGRYAFGNHALTAEFLVSDPNVSNIVDFLAGVPNEFGTLSGRALFIGRAGYEWQEGRFRLLFTAVDFDHDFDADSPAALPGNVKLFAPFVSAQVNLEDWSFTAEYLRTGLRRTGIFFEERLPPDPVARKFFLDNTLESYYLQVQYRFAPEWSAIARYDAFFANADDHDGSGTARGTGLPRHRFYAKDLTFGLRWEFFEDWLVAAEYHNVDGTGWLSPIDNAGINDPARVREVSDGHWDLFALMFSYRF
ncbi:MAG: hypothetical protein ACREA0_17465, partial [bacterium]